MMLELCFAAITLALSALLLRSFGFRAAPVFSALVLLFILSRLPEYFSDFIEVYKLTDIGGRGGAAIMKIIGASYLFGISAELCRELGESGAANAISVVGKLELAAIAMPFISELMKLALSLVRVSP